jgi:hypothetical protein
MSVACSAAECTTAPWDMIPDPECDGCGRPVCSSHAALLDVDVNGRPVSPATAAAKVGPNQWLCDKCQATRLRKCLHGHDLDVVGVYRNGKNDRCRACEGRLVTAS